MKNDNEQYRKVQTTQTRGVSVDNDTLVVAWNSSSSTGKMMQLLREKGFTAELATLQRRATILRKNGVSLKKFRRLATTDYVRLRALAEKALEDSGQVIAA